jgi:DNA-directed RNA polymerase subunit RPC12/RpoP
MPSKNDHPGGIRCPRCSGRLFLEDLPGEREYVCLQCGRRLSAAPDALLNWFPEARKAA